MAGSALVVTAASGALLARTHQPFLPHLFDAQSGEKWTCELDGVQRKESFPSQQLHALQQAGADKAFKSFEPQRLEEKLAPSEISGWLEGYCSNPDVPVRLSGGIPPPRCGSQCYQRSARSATSQTARWKA